MTKDEILEKLKKVKGLRGMTINERLYLTELMDTFDKAKRDNKDFARFILEVIGVDKPSIDNILK